MAYINREKFAQAICSCPAIDESAANAVISLLHRQTTADVEEVKHGEWEDLYNGKYDNPLYICSECNCRALRTNEKDELGQIKGVQELSKYCPNCGAKMDERRKT